MAARTDLAIESSGINTGIEGIKQIKRNGTECRITEIVVENDEAGKKIGKGKGKYITIESEALSSYTDRFEDVTKSIASEIAALIPKQGDVLVIGLGNNDITPDALGPKVISHIFATRHLSSELPEDEELSDLRPVSALSPGVLGQTGIEVAEVTKAVCDKINPAVVVVIDALACSDISRLGTTIQLTDTGISPGSGVQNRRKELSHNTLGVPVVAVGVPTVVDMHTIAENITGKSADKSMPNMMVTPRDIDKLIEKTAKLIAFAVNKAVLPQFSISAFLAG